MRPSHISRLFLLGVECKRVPSSSCLGLHNNHFPSVCFHVCLDQRMQSDLSGARVAWLPAHAHAHMATMCQLRLIHAHAVSDAEDRIAISKPVVGAARLAPSVARPRVQIDCGISANTGVPRGCLDEELAYKARPCSSVRLIHFLLSLSYYLVVSLNQLEAEN